MAYVSTISEYRLSSPGKVICTIIMSIESEHDKLLLYAFSFLLEKRISTQEIYSRLKKLDWYHVIARWLNEESTK